MNYVADRITYFNSLMDVPDWLIDSYSIWPELITFSEFLDRYYIAKGL